MANVSYGWAEKGKGVEEYGKVTGIDITDNFVEIVSHTVASNKKFYITDVFASASENGIFRIKLNGLIVSTFYYSAGSLISISRQTPARVNESKVVKIEFSTAVDSAKATAHIGGYEIQY